MELEPGMAHMELPQLRYFVTLAEELHFGWAAAREHMVQSALGQASLAPPKVTAQLFRLDPLGVLVPEGHRLAASQEVPVAKLAAQLAPSRGSCRGGVGAA